MLPLQVAIALLSFVAAAALALHGAPTIVAYHLVFAVGIAPLILAAMLHFIPVLTRTAPPPVTIRLLPLVTLGAGLPVVGHFAFAPLLPSSHLAGGAIVALAAITQAGWALRLRARAIGGAHPCLDWYLAALACLGIALAAILLAHHFPAQYLPLRRLHLHLNLLGFIGLTALGTLQVLLPTCAGQPDPLAARRLRSQLKWVAGGVLAIAAGAAWQSGLAGAGLLMLLYPLGQLARDWLRHYRSRIFAWHGATPTLAAALAGFCAMLALAALQGLAGTRINPTAGYIVAFLLPLVTGAASHLLPLWLRPGRQTSWHHFARQRLGYGSALRALTLLAGGVLLAAGQQQGWLLALLGALAFILQVASLRANKVV